MCGIQQWVRVAIAFIPCGPAFCIVSSIEEMAQFLWPVLFLLSVKIELSLYVVSLLKKVEHLRCFSWRPALKAKKLQWKISLTQELT